MKEVKQNGPVPMDAMNGVIPYVAVDGAETAAEFYSKAFGAVEAGPRMASDDGKRMMHIHLIMNGGSLMLCDPFPEYGQELQPSHSYTMTLVVADGQAWWDRAVAAGCRIKMPFAKAPWGDLYGGLLDPFGVNWAINQPVPPG